MGFLEPFVIPGFDRLLVKLFLIATAAVIWMLAVTTMSIVGIIRAIRRRRRRQYSTSAIVLASVAVATISMWLLYWASYDLLHHENPLNPMLAINLSLGILPVSWLIIAIRTKSAVTTTAES